MVFLVACISARTFLVKQEKQEILLVLVHWDFLPESHEIGWFRTLLNHPYPSDLGWNPVLAYAHGMDTY